jgi:hypothetical protein
MHEGQINVIGNTIEFYEVDSIYLPKICLVCGKTTDYAIEKSLIGDFSYDKEKRKDFHIKIAICEDCNRRICLTKSAKPIKITLFSLLGLLGALILYYFTLSLFMALTIFAISFFVSFLYCSSRDNKILYLNRFLELKTTSLSRDTADDVLQMKFFNEHYKNHVIKINLEQNKSLKLVKAFKANTIS